MHLSFWGQELHFSLPPGIPVMDKEEDVFLLTKRLFEAEFSMYLRYQANSERN